MRDLLIATLARLTGQDVNQDATTEEITQAINKALEDMK